MLLESLSSLSVVLAGVTVMPGAEGRDRKQLKE